MGDVGLDELLLEVRGCTLCSEHLPLGPRPVFQVGAQARILIAGQAPGRRVHESGVPFQDPSGDRLRAWLGITKEEFYDPNRFAILPMGFCYPGTGKTGDFPPRPECAPKWRALLLNQMKQLELTLVIGQYAQGYHLPSSEKTLTEMVANWRSYGPGGVPLPHPSPRNHRWLAQNPWFEAELLPVLRKNVRRILDA